MLSFREKNINLLMLALLIFFTLYINKIKFSKKSSDLRSRRNFIALKDRGIMNIVSII